MLLSLAKYADRVRSAVTESYYGVLLEALERHVSSYGIIFTIADQETSAMRIAPDDARWDAIAEALVLSRARLLWPDADITSRYHLVEQQARDGFGRWYLFELLRALEDTANVIAVEARVAESEKHG